MARTTAAVLPLLAVRSKPRRWPQVELVGFTDEEKGTRGRFLGFYRSEGDPIPGKSHGNRKGRARLALDRDSLDHNTRKGMRLTCGSHQTVSQWRGTGWSAKGWRGTRCAGLAIGPREGGGACCARWAEGNRRGRGDGPRPPTGERKGKQAFRPK